MKEPTHKQHLLLEEIYDNFGSMGVLKSCDEDDIEIYWELVMAGYLKNLVMLVGKKSWRFVFTENGEQYMLSSR